MSSFTEALKDRFTFAPAIRDDEQVAQIVRTTKTMDSIHNLEDEAVLDHFMAYLSEIGVLKSFSDFRASQYQRVMIPFYYFLVTYMAKTLLAVTSMRSLPALLFSDQGIMRTLGFSAFVLEEGYCDRGAGKRKEGTKPASPFTHQTLAEFMTMATPQEMEQLFNTDIALLAASGVFHKKVTGIVDGTDIETTPTYKGAGMVRRKKKEQKKTGIKEVECILYGWKAIALFDRHTEIPIAVKVVPIHEHESSYARTLIEQAQRNLGTYSQLTKILMDRGFLDGATLYWLTGQKITFVVPAKSNMDITEDARRLALADMGITEIREEAKTTGRGKHKTESLQVTQITGVTDLTSYNAYRDPEKPVKVNRKNDVGSKINAVVVRQYRNEFIKPEQWPVFLTNGSVEHPFEAYDDYDDRSLIENLLFREGKQGWNLQHAPTRTENGVISHVYMTFLTMALTTAYRSQEEDEGEAQDRPSSLSPTIGIRNWRRRLVQENQDQVIVFCGIYYGIVHLMDFVQLMGGQMKVQSATKSPSFRRTLHRSP
ncbi:transposase [uncultured Paenibacillus sp.]|uniref:transposase n=1 Tax=uncultured Paenibacillus sp. TaxID=227322 RepID=UPI0028D551E9|nr:transposase [uncultured Paenibacillus sp.]